jgi:hypothetical protein
MYCGRNAGCRFSKTIVFPMGYVRRIAKLEWMATVMPARVGKKG